MTRASVLGSVEPCDGRPRGFQDRARLRQLGEQSAYNCGMVQSLESLLADGQGDVNWPAIYQCLKTPLWYAAARGARRAGVRDREAIAEAGQQAVGEIMN